MGDLNARIVVEKERDRDENKDLLLDFIMLIRYELPMAEQKSHRSHIFNKTIV